MATETETMLVRVEDINPIDVFTGVGIDDLLSSIEKEVSSIEPDLTTVKGRKEVASIAHKVSKSKVVLDNLGKELVTGWKQKAKQVDEARKKSRDFLDDLRDKVRQPLTDWELAEEARISAEKLAKEIAEAEELAHQENDLFNRQREIEAKEAELGRQEEERRQKEEAERLEQERIVREEQLRKEGEERAKREAEEKARKEREEAERRIKEEQERAERAERERVAAAERAETEKKDAIRKAKEEAAQEAQRKEDERLRKEAAEKAEADRLAADKKHRRAVNVAAVESLANGGFTEEQAKNIVRLIASGKIANVSINY